MSNPFETDLPQQSANYSPLSPISFLSRTALVHQQGISVIHGERRWTWADTYTRCLRLASALSKKGIGKGDTVSVMAPNIPAIFEAHFGVLMTGAVLNTLNIRLEAETLSYIFEHAETKVLLTDREFSSVIKRALSNVRHNIIVIDIDDPEIESGEFLGEMEYEEFLKEGDPEFEPVLPEDDWQSVSLNYTSGTTGFPKGAVHTHNLLRNVEERGFRMAISPSDTILNYLPLFHAFGYSEGALMSLVTGARQIITQLFDPDECLDLIENEKVSVIHGFEAHAKGLTEAQLEGPRDLSSLRTGLFASGMHSATPVIRRAIETLKPLKNMGGFGMTEVWLGVAIGTLGDTVEQRSESSGAPGIGYRNRIVDPETLAPCPVGVPGEWQVQGEFLMQGYYKKPAETAASYTDDDWFRTGDMAEWREDGYIRFLGRYKDMLKVGGENVDPMEVEGLLLEHPAIHQVAVVGQRHDKMSEVPVAFVQLAPGEQVSAAEVTAYCTGKVAGFKVPRRVEFIDEFPMTASGKIRKVELRERLEEEC